MLIAADETPDGEWVECENCGWRGESSEGHQIRMLLERVGPGEIMPACECPRCGAVCHLMNA